MIGPMKRCQGPPQDEPEELQFEQLFDLEAIQRMQDEFALATGVASIITQPDGTPITRPSSFCRLCQDIIRGTKTGSANCGLSDALLGSQHREGPVVRQCLSGGLWEAGASITAGDRHIANWLVGQVRDETQSEEKIREYARTIGADENEAIEAFRKVPSMSFAALTRVARALFTLAKLLSTSAYQNVQQARFIQEREATEKALRESEKTLRESQKVAGLGSYVLSVSTGQWKSSEVLDKLFGINATYERTVEGWAALIHPDDRAMMLDHFRNEVLGKGQTFNKEYRIIRHEDRAERVVHGMGRLEFSPEGQALNMHGTIQDITERKRAEAEKEKIQVQLQRAQRIESVGRLAGGVAHDFNNMLQAILGNVELALGEIPANSPARESLIEIRASARRSADLTRQLLALARKQTIAPRTLNLNETLEGLLKMLRRLLGEDIHLAWMPASDLGMVHMDPTQVDQILANLCINARDAIAGVGKITIETAPATFSEEYCADHPGYLPGEYVLMAVSDDGCGMDKETQAQIFEPFFTTKPVGEGTGLGLATVYGIVRQNHGFINVYSEPGKGTSFKIYLPRHATAAAAARVDAPSPPPRSHGETVLLVEDEPAILNVARRVLQRLGYTVLTAATPTEAVRLAETHAGMIHLLITDVVMPEMNGRDLASRLSSHCPGLECLFMSGYTANVIAHHGVLDEGTHFIQKPFSVEDLAAKVRAVLASED